MRNGARRTALPPLAEPGRLPASVRKRRQARLGGFRTSPGGTGHSGPYEPTGASGRGFSRRQPASGRQVAGVPSLGRPGDGAAVPALPPLRCMPVPGHSPRREGGASGRRRQIARTGRRRSAVPGHRGRADLPLRPYGCPGPGSGELGRIVPAAGRRPRLGAPVPPDPAGTAAAGSPRGRPGGLRSVPAHGAFLQTGSRAGARAAASGYSRTGGGPPSSTCRDSARFPRRSSAARAGDAPRFAAGGLSGGPGSGIRPPAPQGRDRRLGRFGR